MSLCINPSCASPQNSDEQLFCSSCGSETLLEGRYRVIRMLGEGGFGKTYEVTDLDSVVKVLKILTRNEPKYVELFQREAQVLSQLNHPGIPAVEPNAYFTFRPKNEPEPLYCLVMEKITGLDLQKYLRQRGSPIDQNLALQWLIQLARILKAVHSQNFLHRDIKPSNIMLKADGHLSLIDFGTVRSITNIYGGIEEPSQATRIMSALYTPIEQMKGKPLPQSDFFAMGRTFVYLLTGQELADMYDPDTDELNWRSLVPNLSPLLADFIDQMMSPLASRRPVNGDVLLHKLFEIQRQLLTSATTLPQQMGNAPTVLAFPRQDLGANLGISPRSGPEKGVNAAPANAEMVPSQSNSSQSNPSQSNLSQSNLSQSNPSQSNPSQFNVSQPSSGSVSTPAIRPEFALRCQQELAEFIGPIASIVCQRALRQKPPLSERDFVEALAQQISSSEDAQSFRRRMS